MHGRLRARPGAVVARRHPGRLQRQAAGARHGPLRADHGGRDPARPGDGRRAASAGSSTGPEAFTPDNEFILGESEVRGFFVAAGFSAHGIAGAGGIGRQMATWIVDGAARARPLEDGHPPVRAGVPVAGATRSRARSRTTRPTTTSTTPTRSASPAGRCGRRRPTTTSSALGRVLRREVRLGAPELVRVERRRPGDEALRPARLGRAALVAGHRRRGARHPAGGRPLRRDRRSPSSR